MSVFFTAAEYTGRCFVSFPSFQFCVSRRFVNCSPLWPGGKQHFSSPPRKKFERKNENCFSLDWRQVVPRTVHFHCLVGFLHERWHYLVRKLPLSTVPNGANNKNAAVGQRVGRHIFRWPNLAASAGRKLIESAALTRTLDGSQPENGAKIHRLFPPSRFTKTRKSSGKKKKNCR